MRRASRPAVCVHGAPFINRTSESSIMSMGRCDGSPDVGVAAEGEGCCGRCHFEISSSNTISKTATLCSSKMTFKYPKHLVHSMFKSIELWNFRVFGHMLFDLSGPRGVPLDHAVVYGRNASGKTALMASVDFLRASVASFRDVMSGGAGDLPALARANVMRQSESPMVLSFVFEIDGRDAEYRVSFSQEDGRVVEESLRYVSLKGRMVSYFTVTCTGSGPKALFNDRVIPKSDLRSWAEGQAEQWWGRHTMMSMLVWGALERNSSYMESEMPGLLRVAEFLDGLNSSSVSADGMWIRIEREPMQGWIDADGIGTLRAFEHALDRFLTRIDPDLEGVGYETFDMAGDRIGYRLGFDRYISGRVRRVWCDEESSGVRRLVELFPKLLGCAEGRVAFIDEVDSGIHDKLMRDLFTQILPDMKGQLVITTHNTVLLERVDPRKVFIIEVDSDGSRRIGPISAIARTRANNNNRDRYMRGDLGGVPHIACVDMENIIGHFLEDVGCAPTR